MKIRTPAISDTMGEYEVMCSDMAPPLPCARAEVVVSQFKQANTMTQIKPSLNFKAHLLWDKNVLNFAFPFHFPGGWQHTPDCFYTLPQPATS
jgi:hypothetical protein